MIERLLTFIVFIDVAARLCAGDGSIPELVGTARSFLNAYLLFRNPLCLSTHT